MREYHFYVYIMASRSLTLYIGFTSKLQLRVSQHKNGTFVGFSKTYNCNRLVYYERFQFAADGINREKQLKRWSRAKKIALIKTVNPAWADLSEDWANPSLRFMNLRSPQRTEAELRVSPLRITIKPRCFGRDDK